MLTEKCLAGICNEVPNYPEKLAIDFVNKLKASNSFKIFNEDLLVNTTYKSNSTHVTPLCKSREEISIPQVAKSKNGTWHYILNPKYEAVQRFRVEICSFNKEEKEKEISSAVQEKESSSICADRVRNRNYEGVCVQKYVLRKMVAISGDSVFSDYFHIPSCCSCVARSYLD
ncbi:protein spaetzle 5-like [Zerene cesonia]|uniref:protein spaetzle 5-like n=1 Tax=Zerene cesonia TaxID=33412 RepID=UPI0018E54947|nr:protein spaetzle 5-like [Zerene cesonia]